MLCKQCSKGVLIRQYRVVNARSEAFNTDKYFDSLEEAEELYEYLRKHYIDKYKLSELLICNDCDYVDEKAIKWED